MANAVVVGAGPVGLATAMLLAQKGMDVVVLDRDDPAPTEAGQACGNWERRSVAQFQQVHLLQAAARVLLEQRLPSVVEEMTAIGVNRFNLAEQVARRIPGGAGDADLSPFETQSTCRRPMLEYGFVAAARLSPGIEIRNNCPVTELVTGREVVPGVPHVVGVMTEAGEVVTGDVILDVAGRRSPISAMIAAVGGQRPDERSEDLGFAYNTRYFRGPTTPEYLADVLSPVGSFSILTMPGDNGYWSVTLYHSSKDKTMRKVRDPEVFDRVVRSFPLHAHWVEGEATSEVYSMVSTANTTREFVVDGRPCVTGLLPIGDAWGFTNPSLGRGITLGLKHAVAVTDAVVDIADRPELMAATWNEITQDQTVPWHESTVQFDRVRGPEVEAFRLGQPDPHDPSDPRVAISRAFASATHYDAQVLAWNSEIANCMTLAMEVLSRPGVIERILEVAGENPTYVTPGPDRAQLEELLV